MIYGTVGTMHKDFARFIRALDEFAKQTDEEVVIQTGLDSTVPEHADHFDFRSRDEVLELQRNARVIVTHAGIGSVIDALQCGISLIVVPRLKRYGEHNNDHQLDLARAVERRGWGKLLLDTADLPDALASPPPPYTDYVPAKKPLLEAVRAATLRAAESR
ncbi:MAG: beta-1,4-galactosyltransferase [Candidatus Hydrogenedentota bacterium]|nr:MAG: beta-1,4-galactosyltransferase [Candidatus Hydrogenedentota bacterium]